MLDIPCVIFAGGKSSRMGEDKALLPFSSSKTLTQYQLNRLKKIFKKVYISCKDQHKFNFDANFIEDIPSKDVFAPTTGFIAVFKELKEERFFALSVDAPFISIDEIEKLLNADSAEFDATVSKTDMGMQPMCAIYHRSLHKEFVKMLQEDTHKLGYLLKNSNTQYIYFKNEKPFFNLNNPQQYQEALRLI
ncbi:MAG: molybdenum cofactor guanylyltransferase MobA [Sulfurimonas sp.]